MTFSLLRARKVGALVSGTIEGKSSDIVQVPIVNMVNMQRWEHAMQLIVMQVDGLHFYACQCLVCMPNTTLFQLVAQLLDPLSLVVGIILCNMPHVRERGRSHRGTGSFRRIDIRRGSPTSWASDTTSELDNMVTRVAEQQRNLAPFIVRQDSKENPNNAMIWGCMVEWYELRMRQRMNVPRRFWFLCDPDYFRHEMRVEI